MESDFSADIGLERQLKKLPSQNYKEEKDFGESPVFKFIISIFFIAIILTIIGLLVIGVFFINAVNDDKFKDEINQPIDASSFTNVTVNPVFNEDNKFDIHLNATIILDKIEVTVETNGSH